MAPLRVILNPAAGGGKAGRLRGELEAGLRSRGIPYLLSITAGPGHARVLASEASLEGEERLMVVGGDGTIHEVANGLLASGPSETALSVVPVGTGNDFFRMVGIPRRLSSALDLLGTGKVARVDVGRARFGHDERVFVNLLGIGLDVEVLRTRPRFRGLSGHPQYLAALAATLLTFRRFSLDVEFDSEGGGISGPTILAGITVGRSIGGGFLISPDASPRDGLLDLFFIEPLGPARLARYIPRVLRGTHGGVPEFHSRKVREARFSRSDGEPFHFELDGELMPNPVAALMVEIVAEALPVLVPGAQA